MQNRTYAEMLKHIGHKASVCIYGGEGDEKDAITIECKDCGGEVLAEFGKWSGNYSPKKFSSPGDIWKDRSKGAGEEDDVRKVVGQEHGGQSSLYDWDFSTVALGFAGSVVLWPTLGWFAILPAFLMARMLLCLRF